ncbi:hypothetical protein K491DRAFT_75218 [Lophiostoma macrostomum CBS 122681]|uniref:Uncharacterized protein n=1 Tax=Lophiostoma macrostomum CBS 122681 TaxID=1314788 RepID=A0A6A6SWC9_9PLEO|nr:hypothetical protein K491DRAFT_75218 [Lophiostoma macrostomum CBS 122681]
MKGRRSPAWTQGALCLFQNAVCRNTAPSANHRWGGRLRGATVFLGSILFSGTCLIVASMER